MHIHMKRKNHKRKSAKSYPRKRENKGELLKASNEAQKPQKKELKKVSLEERKQTRASESLNETEKPQKKSTWDFRQRDYRPGRGGNPILCFICVLRSHSPISNH